MNAFREFSEIVSLLQPVAGAHPQLLTLQQPNAERLSELFASLLNMQGEEKSRALAILNRRSTVSRVNRGKRFV